MGRIPRVIPPMRLLALLIFFTLGCSRVFADGAYRHQHLLEPAQIPRQSAAISFADGKQTLTVWNTIEAKGQDLAWVLPLPAKPEIIRPSHPNAFKLLQSFTPIPVKAGGGRPGVAVPLLLLCGLVLMVLKRSRGSQRFAAAVAVVWVMVYIFHPRTSGEFGAESGVVPEAGVKVLSAKNAGNYETRVISGTSAEAVNDWLKSAGFPPFAGGELQTLEAYVARKWVFLCSRLKTAAKGPSAGHPLSVRFPVEKPVYPMSLTKSAGTVPVEIFWMGDPVREPSGRLTAAGVSDSRSRHGAHYSMASKFWDLAVARASHGVAGSESLQEFYVAEDQDLLLDQIASTSAVIRFTATFTQSSDWSDLHFEPAGEMPKVPLHVTRERIINDFTNSGEVLSIAVGFFLLGVAGQFYGKQGRRPHIGWAGAGLVLLLTAGGWVWSHVPEDLVIVDNSQVKQPAADGSDPAEEWFQEWIKHLKETK